MLPSASDIEYFLMVAQTGNISRAAERLGISQPSLSLALKRLEDVTGTTLLIRSRTGVELTRSGKRLVSGGRNLLEDWVNLKKLILQEESAVTGVFTIGLHASVAIFACAPMFKDLLRKYKGLEFRFIHDLSRRICEEIISFKIDFGVVVNPVSHPDLVIKELYKDKVGFWTVAGGAQDTLIVQPELVQSQELIRRVKESKLSIGRTISSSNLEVIASMVEAGMGVGILPERVAKKFSNRLKLVGAKMPSFDDRHCLVYRADTQKGAAAKAVIEAVKNAKV